MLDFDQETWLYLAIIAAILIYFSRNSRRAKNNRKIAETEISEEDIWNAEDRKNLKILFRRKMTHENIH